MTSEMNGEDLDVTVRSSTVVADLDPGSVRGRYEGRFYILGSR